MSERLLANLHGFLMLITFAVQLHLWGYLHRYKDRIRRPIPVLAIILFCSLWGANLAGWEVYPEYRSEIKPELALDRALEGVPTHNIANLFDVKEHLGFYSLVVGTAVCTMLWMLRRRPLDPPTPLPRYLLILNSGILFAGLIIGLTVSTYMNF